MFGECVNPTDEYFASQVRTKGKDVYNSREAEGQGQMHRDCSVITVHVCAVVDSEWPWTEHWAVDQTGDVRMCM